MSGEFEWQIEQLRDGKWEAISWFSTESQAHHILVELEEDTDGVYRIAPAGDPETAA